MIDPGMVTTSIELNGYRISKNLGVVRGITVRSRSILGNLAGGLQTLMGGRISIYVELCETTRKKHFSKCSNMRRSGAPMQLLICAMMLMK